MADRGTRPSVGGDVPKLLAFYLPQFHPTPENDLWRGKGYTEWTNVARAVPAFEGHYQPRIPADLGFYDLRLPEVREAQARLAERYGIHGFCYYHYWFNGRRLLERPFDEVLESGEPEFPFCLAWANHTWTWKRDHGHDGRLMEQQFSEEDDRNHIRWLLEAFRDDRYIRIDGRPLLPIYWVQSIPEPRRTFDLWREEAERAGEKPPYVLKMDSFGNFDDPLDLGCDGSVEFWPHNVQAMVPRVEEPEQGYVDNRVYEYQQFAVSHLERLRGEKPEFKRFPCVVPQWDNTARWKATGANILHGSTPDLYRGWLGQVIDWTCENFEADERFIFINAWNEWGEGAYLEPDLRFGRGYLEATRDALADNGFAIDDTEREDQTESESASVEQRYEKLLRKFDDLQKQLAQYQLEEEQSALVQRIEHNYQLLDGQNQALRGKYNALQRKLAATRRQLHDLEAKTIVARPLHSELNREQLVHWLEQLDDKVTALLNSKRWRTTETVMKVSGRLRGDNSSHSLEDEIQALLHDFRSKAEASSKNGR